MHPDLALLVKLQIIESEQESARRAIDALPARHEAIEAAVAQQAASVEAVRQKLSDNQSARRGLERELTIVQGRLTKFKDQLMEVKTNREYQAMQVEIGTAQNEVKRIEDLLLERMIESDDLAAQLKSVEADLVGRRAEAQKQLAELDEEAARLAHSLDGAAAQRADVVAAMSPELLSTFEFIRTHRGTAVVEARDGHCTVCHVRLRPQVFNEVRLNASILKCDSCGRILYFVPPAQGQASAASQSS
jgi:predicted  nucleic acid-binding Zn-ribbon protein